MSFSLFGVTGWGIRGTVTAHHAEKTVGFTTKTGDNVSFYDLIESTGDFKDKANFYLHPSAFNGALQTMFLNSKINRPVLKKVHYGRRLFNFKDGGIASLDYVLATPNSPAEVEQFQKLTEENLKLYVNWPRQNKGTRFLSNSEIVLRTTPDLEDDSNVLIILHGLGGGSHEPLIKDLITCVTGNAQGGSDEESPFFKEIMVLNCRGCSRTKITTPYLFCGFSTGDLREVVQEINTKFPKRKIFLAGYSFGTVTILNYLAEESKAHTGTGKINNIQLASCVGVPWDLVASSHHLGSSVTGTKVFEPALISFLTRIVKNNRKELEELGKWTDVDFSDEKLKTIKNMADFDDMYTAKMFNFNSGFEYYRKTSPVNRIYDIKVPTVLVNSIDDPCIDINLPTRETKKNPYLIQVETDLGGHLAFIDTKNESWVNKATSKFFKKYIETVDQDGKVDNVGYEKKLNVFGA